MRRTARDLVQREGRDRLAVLAGVRALDPGTPYPFPTVMENYKAKDALFEAYK